MRLIDGFLSECERFGVRELFGIPGDFVLPFFQALEKSARLPLHYLSHEPSAVFAADAAARITNRPSVVVLTYGAGALNAVNAIAQAYVEHVPLIVVAGFPSAPEIARGLEIHHQAKHVNSQRDIYQEITALQVRLDQPEHAAAAMREAFQTAHEVRRPVLIELPRNAEMFHIQSLPPYIGPALDEPGIAALMSPVAAAIERSQHPVLLAGVDIRRYEASDALLKFAESKQIPVLSSFMGRAALPHTHPMYRGVFLDQSDVNTTQLLADSDCIILVGVIRNCSNFAAYLDLFPSTKVIELDQKHPSLPLRAQLDELNLRVKKVFSWPAASEILENEPSTFCAARVAMTVHEVLGEQTSIVPVISDVRDCLFASLRTSPELLLAPAYYASMGYAVPAAFGVMAATNLRPVVLVGDGAFLMTGLELGHFTRMGFAPVIVLFNNQKWDMIEAFSPGLNCTKLEHWNYTKLAESMGGKGVEVTSEKALNEALTVALDNVSRFTLIDVRLPDNSRTATLHNFATNFLRSGMQPTAESSPDV